MSYRSNGTTRKRSSSSDSFEFSTVPQSAPTNKPAAPLKKQETLKPAKKRKADDAAREVSKQHLSLQESTAIVKEIPLVEAETPMIQRNIKMRTDAGPSTRRVSDTHRGKRASGIGSGLEALPHPTLPDELLYRHIEPDQPEPIRLLTLASWAARRARERLLVPEETHSALADALQDQVQRLALHAVDTFITNLCDKSIDISIPDTSHRPIQHVALQTNPRNLAVAAQTTSLDNWTAAIIQEDEQRRANVKRYNVTRDAASHALATQRTAKPLPVPPMANIPLDVASIQTADDVLSLGRSVRAATQAAKAAQATPRKQRSRASFADSSLADVKETTDEISTIDVEQEIGISFANIRLQANNADMIVHRLESFVAGCSSFVHSRQSANYGLLEAVTRDSLAIGADQIEADTDEERAVEAVSRLLVPSDPSVQATTVSLVRPSTSSTGWQALRALSRQQDR